MTTEKTKLLEASKQTRVFGTFSEKLEIDEETVKARLAAMLQQNDDRYVCEVFRVEETKQFYVVLLPETFRTMMTVHECGEKEKISDQTLSLEVTGSPSANNLRVIMFQFMMIMDKLGYTFCITRQRIRMSLTAPKEEPSEQPLVDFFRGLDALGDKILGDQTFTLTLYTLRLLVLCTKRAAAQRMRLSPLDSPRSPFARTRRQRNRRSRSADSRWSSMSASEEAEVASSSSDYDETAPSLSLGKF